jgi:hypothetical protein
MEFTKGSEVMYYQIGNHPRAAVVYSVRTDINDTCYEIYLKQTNGDIVKTLADACYLEQIDRVNKAVCKNELEAIHSYLDKSPVCNERLNLFKMLIANNGLEVAQQTFKNMGWKIPEC